MKALISFFFLLFAYGSFGQMTYEELMQAYQDCYGIPKSYSTTMRPTALGLGGCSPERSSTTYKLLNETVVDYCVYRIDLYYLKIAAVAESSFIGGMPEGSWRLPGNEQLGTYIAAEGFEAVIMGPYWSDREAWSMAQLLEDKGYCNILLIHQHIEERFEIKIHGKRGNYQNSLPGL